MGLHRGSDTHNYSTATIQLCVCVCVYRVRRGLGINQCRALILFSSTDMFPYLQAKPKPQCVLQMPSSGALERAPMVWLTALHFWQYICPFTYMNLLLTQWLRPLNVTDIGVKISSSEGAAPLPPPDDEVPTTGTPNKAAARLDVWPSGIWGLLVGGVGRHACISVHTYACIKQMCVSVFSPHVTQPHKATASLACCRDVGAFLSGSQQIQGPLFTCAKSSIWATSSLLLCPGFRSPTCGGPSHLWKEHVVNEANAIFIYFPRFILRCHSVVGWPAFFKEVLRRMISAKYFSRVSEKGIFSFFVCVGRISELDIYLFIWLKINYIFCD